MEPHQKSIHLHILLVDDDKDIRRIVGGRLAQVGFEIIYATDGNEGREMARRLQPNLILLDYNMPIMDGMEVATRMKSEDETKHIPIIMLTNEDFSIETQKALKDIGISEYIHKSDDFEVLHKRIQEVLENLS